MTRCTQISEQFVFDSLEVRSRDTVFVGQILQKGFGYGVGQGTTFPRLCGGSHT